MENLQRIVGGYSDIAFSLADTAADAIKGSGTFTARRFRHGPSPACTTTYTQVATVKAKSCITVADLKRQAGSVGAPNPAPRSSRCG